MEFLLMLSIHVLFSATAVINPAAAYNEGLESYARFKRLDEEQRPGVVTNKQSFQPPDIDFRNAVTATPCTPCGAEMPAPKANKTENKVAANSSATLITGAPTSTSSGSFDSTSTTTTLGVKLGGTCSIPNECAAAFSECRDSKCECLPGFKKNGKTCQPEGYSCPFGEAFSVGGNIVHCNTMRSSPEFRTQAAKVDEAEAKAAAAAAEAAGQQYVDVEALNGTCPKDHVCISEGEIQDGQTNGFCCPLATACPVGKPPLNKTCSYSETSEDVEYCPYDTHYCFRVEVGSNSLDQCCPRPCINFNQVYREQCSHNGAVCVNGKCSCEKETIALDRSCIVPYCPFAPGEPLPALKNKDDEYLTCPAHKCPPKFYCSNYGVCCPIPTAYCSDTKTYASPKDQCDMNGPSPQCGAGKNCRSWYSVLSANSATAEDVSSAVTINIGLCCG